MEKVSVSKTQEHLDAVILENVSKWQISKAPLALLNEAQLDIVYQIGDIVRDEYFAKDSEVTSSVDTQTSLNMTPIQMISTNQEYVSLLVQLENDMRDENLVQFLQYFDRLSQQSDECQNLYLDAEQSIEALAQLKNKYQHVTTKTDSLHSLSEQLMKNQTLLKDKKQSINERLHHFVVFNHLLDTVERNSNRVNSKEFISILDQIDGAIDYLNNHLNYKESRIYRMKYESMLTTALTYFYEYVNNIVTEATKHITDPEGNASLLSVDAGSGDSVESAISLYYGKFQSAATKVQEILSYIDSKSETHAHYKIAVFDCQKTYFAQRSPIMSSAVSKALVDLKEQHKNDHSVLFRSSCLFVMKVCQDESMCFLYFFSGPSQQLHDYLAVLCQHLYDNLRPSLIGINHLEVLTELCGILRKEMLNEHIHTNDALVKFADTVRQMLEDVEERLVFRTNVFFQHELLGYKPSPGDLAYPEKLEQMENIAVELSDSRTDSRNSIVSVESQEVANITANQMGPFRSYTGNSPADLHGMWFPTVKRTLVCLSRLYFCLDRQTFQGLAQEALAICVQTIESAANQISARKTVVDAKLFQIKHLLIIREQIAPFQVDFTVKEVALDFSNVRSAAVGLLHNRSKIFTFSSNNALLEFLLEGTPRVKEYLIDSRKEIDKHLKLTCEAFIAHITHMLVGNVLAWLQKTEHSDIHAENVVALREQDFAKPQVIAVILSVAQRNIKLKIPEIQRSMQLYLANRETEFILFRPVKNNVINAFIQMEQLLSSGQYTVEDQLMIACPSAEQINVLISSVSLTIEQDTLMRLSRSRKASQASQQESDGETRTEAVVPSNV